MERPKENTGKMLPGIGLCKATLDMTSTAEAVKGKQVYRWDYIKPQSFPCAAKNATCRTGENTHNVSDEGLIPRVHNELQKFNSKVLKETN